MSHQGPVARLKASLHPKLDPLLSLPDSLRARMYLLRLPDGIHRAKVTVPYYSQFASADRVYDYIHNDYDGTTDPNWPLFGAREAADYAFWAPRVCALAVLKMAIEAFYPDKRPTLWQLVVEGLKLNGYAVRNARGLWVDQGWYVEAQIQLAAQYGLVAEPHGYASPLSLCKFIRQGWLVAATVTPDIGERAPLHKQYGGHLVLVYGFEWQQGRPTHFLLHNPSGRFPELQADARIPADSFKAAFAHRLITLRPAQN